MPVGERRGGGGYGGGNGLVPSRTAQRNKKGLLGLSNLGNTCFMNAALQCLTHTHGMQKYFRFCSHAYTSRGQSSRQRLLMAFAHWFERDWGKNVSAHYHSPEDILRSVQQLNPMFQGYSQQDSQEFLRCVLDSIHEELKREVPDDLDGHLRCLGCSEDGGGSSSTSDASAQPSRPSPQRSRGPSAASPSSDFTYSGGEELPRSSPADLMQFCQAPEIATDVGEIRLPARSSSAPRAPSESGDSTATAASSSSSRPQGDAPGGGEEESSSPAAKTHFESIISEIFEGRVVSCVRCLECKKTSRTSELVYDVSVPIPNANDPSGPVGSDGSPLSSLASSMSPTSSSVQRQGSGGLRAASSWSGVLGGLGGKVKSWFYDKGVDVSDCLRRYCAPEYLTGKDQFFCERCKRKHDCEKRLVFKDLPEVLCIHKAASP
eukprot:TRINITY_DN12332_c0_g1_i1.p1 TRINITY_DN12332_c0_g1~~TRINITY_DN12332_c0_g1_i1.p1  ORF type:complete len:474 (-),score=83.52 TRINITY_DN12332_c0_g1_i1:140-1438(-)